MPGSRYVTNLGNTASSYWKPWLKAPSVTVGKDDAHDVVGRCLMPVTKFVGLRIPTVAAAGDAIGGRLPFSKFGQAEQRLAPYSAKWEKARFFSS